MPQPKPSQPEPAKPQVDEDSLLTKESEQWVQLLITKFVPFLSTLGSAGIFLVLLSQQQWVIAILTFPVMLICALWTTYTKSFTKRFKEIMAVKGDEHAETLAEWLGLKLYRIWWQFARVEDKYLQCQSYECSEYTTEGWKGSFTPNLAEVFVPLQLQAASRFEAHLMAHQPNDQEEGSKIWDIVRQTKKNSAFRRVVILSQGGYGKTTLLRHITYTYGKKRQAHFQVPALLPVLIYLRHAQKTLIKNLELDLAGYIEQHHIPELPESERLKFPTDWAKNQLLNGKMLVMFDGFDEVDLDWRTDLSEWIGQQVRRYPRTKFILTSRPKGYSDFSSDCMQTSLEVQKFSPKQQKDFITQWYRVRKRYDKGGKLTHENRINALREANSLISQLAKDPQLQELAKIPLQLNLLINLHYYYPAPDELPKHRTKLYKEIIELQLGARPLRKSINMGIGAEEAQKVLQKVAFLMFQQEGKKAEISYQDLEENTAKYLKGERITANDFIEKVEKVSELIVKKDENYQFSHLSFQAYLVALEIIETGQEEILLKSWHDYFWKETIKLYVTLIKQPSAFIRLLKGIQDDKAQKLADACLRELPKEKIDQDLQVEERLKLEELQQENFLFKRLEIYLKHQQFKEADQETDRVMLQVVGKEENQYLSIEDIKNFSYAELKIIDELWKKYSNGKFGFSVQKQIWLHCGGVPGEYEWDPFEKFAKAVNWLVVDKWHEDMEYTIGGVKGHLPWITELSEERIVCLFSRGDV